MEVTATDNEGSAVRDGRLKEERGGRKTVNLRRHPEVRGNTPCTHFRVGVADPVSP